jgi:Co/Zn/Cd efflux system component
MAMKKWFHHLQPVQLYLMLGLTIFFFLVQLIMSHMTHALTLLVDSYHMFCNVIALVGCIITIKVKSNDQNTWRNWYQLCGTRSEIFWGNQP